MKSKITVKSNLSTIIKSNYIRIREIDNRDAIPDIKISELRKIGSNLEGAISVIEHTGTYLEEMSSLLSIRRELYSLMQKYVDKNNL